MRSFPFDHLHAVGIHALIKITRGINVIRFTTSETPIVIGGETWVPGQAAALTNVQYLADGTPTNADVQIMAKSGGLIEPGDGVRGLLDGWPIEVKLIDPANPASGVYDLIPGATIGSVAEATDGLVTIAASGRLSLAKTPLCEQYSTIGKEVLGDDRCKVPIEPPDIGRNVTFVRPDVAGGLQHVKDAFGRVRTGTAGTVEDYANVYYECTVAGITASVAPAYDATIGNTTIDGSAQFIARNAWMRAARGQATSLFEITLDALPDARASDAAWFAFGNIIPRSGPLSNMRIPIRAWDPDALVVTLFEPFLASNFPADTQFELHRGCDLTIATCASVFANQANIRATPLVPASNVLTGRSS